MLIRKLHYVELSDAYKTVKQFVEEQTGGEINSLRVDIEEQLGIAGDDTEELLKKFINTFGLSSEGFAFDRHFYTEGELFSSGPALANIFVLLIKISLWLIEVLSFKQIKFAHKPEWYRPSNREVVGLTFKQLLVWYLEKNFKKVDSISYRFTLATY